MALAAAAQKVTIRQHGPSCGFGKILTELTAEDTEFFQAMVDEKRTYSYIAEVFKNDGYDTNAYTVGRHLRGDCKCR